jgi:hypothetical protein
MARNRSTGPNPHAFRNKLLLNQWLLSLFGIDPLAENERRPFHLLAEPIKDPKLEGLDADNLHHFYHYLGDSPLFRDAGLGAMILGFRLDRSTLLHYEENIVRHTQTINQRRTRPVAWKYYQWLTLLFAEIYLDRFFNNRDGMLADLNAYTDRFNEHWGRKGYERLARYENGDREKRNPLPFFSEDDLNKLCLQNATGSGKTLIMHVNLLQYRHYAEKHGRANELSRVILLTPNARLSEQHLAELWESGISAGPYLQTRGGLYAQADGLSRVDVLEITTLADQEGPNTVATRSLGDQNLLLVDEGHRGMSGKGKDEGVWFARRSELCAKGFAFEYSATFEQAVRAAKNADFENSYARTIYFDYSYRWFYEDGFGKDYKIDNLPHPDKATIQRLVEKGNIKKASHLEHARDVGHALMPTFLTACVLKFYQQLRIYQEKAKIFEPFNLEKPLWVFVGSTVAKAKGSKDEEIVAADVARIIQFIVVFLDQPEAAKRRMTEILTGRGQDTGLVDQAGNDIFEGAFTYLARAMSHGETVEDLYRDILARLFNHEAGGRLVLDRIKGESGEVALRVGSSDVPFGLINVGDAKGLCDHVAEVAAQENVHLTVEDSEFTEAMFASVKDSISPIHLLIGSKKFVEGWDCWRVSTMGLMHVGKSEGTQIIQLFGRGVRLKGFDWSLKRSGHSQAPVHPEFIEELETLNVFGIQADFMERFREFLKEEGLPGNERRKIITIPLNVTYDFGKRLKILRPKRKRSDGREYDFKRDAPAPTVGEIPGYLTENPVVADWYPRIQSMQSRAGDVTVAKNRAGLREDHLALLDYDSLFFELERFKRERSWHNLNISKKEIRNLLSSSTWYTLLIPQNRLNPTDYEGVVLLQQVASELLKRYCDHYYNYAKRSYIEPRLELRDLTEQDDNFPDRDRERTDGFWCDYQLIVDGDDQTLINNIQQIKKDIADKKKDLLQLGDLKACSFGRHLFQPLFHVRKGGKITIQPVVLNESEYEFVLDLKAWCEAHNAELEKDGIELFLLRNMSRGRGVGFFEAGRFHPDFILWMLTGNRQYVTFIDPHGLLIGSGPGDEKIKLHKTIKDIEKRLNDPEVILNSFVLSWTAYSRLKWDQTREALEDMHVLFMQDYRDHYIDKLFAKLKGSAGRVNT